VTGRGGGYRYFGAAKALPGVRELFEKEPPKKVLLECGLRVAGQCRVQHRACALVSARIQCPSLEGGRAVSR